MAPVTAAGAATVVLRTAEDVTGEAEVVTTLTALPPVVLAARVVTEALPSAKFDAERVIAPLPGAFVVIRDGDVTVAAP
jgi:hypothetical protein